MFNIKNDFLEQKQLKKDFNADPIAVCERLRSVLEQGSVSNRAVREVQIRENNIQKAMELIDSSAEIFAQSLSSRNSVFRGGEESVRAYRTLVPFLLSLEGRRNAIRAEMRGLSRWRDCLVELRPFTEGLHGGVAALRFFADTEGSDLKIVQMIEELKQDVKLELDEQKRTLKRIEEDLSVMERIDREVIGHFFGSIYEASDSEHDGENCHCTKVLELIANLKDDFKYISLRRG